MDNLSWIRFYYNKLGNLNIINSENKCSYSSNLGGGYDTRVILNNYYSGTFGLANSGRVWFDVSSRFILHCLAYYDKIAPYSTQIFEFYGSSGRIVIHYDSLNKQIQSYDGSSNKGVPYILYTKTLYSFDLIYEGNNSYKFYINGNHIIPTNFQQCEKVTFVSEIRQGDWNNNGIWNDLFFISGNDINTGMIKKMEQ